MPGATRTANNKIDQRFQSWGFRGLTALVASLVTVAATFAVAASPAEAGGCRAAPYSDSMAVTDMFDQHLGVEVFSYPTSGTYRTTTQCRDIQVRNTGDGKISGPFHACVVFDGRATCNNGWTYVPPGQWRNLAVNVKDGTRFSIWISVNLGTWYSATAVGDW